MVKIRKSMTCLYIPPAVKTAHIPPQAMATAYGKGAQRMMRQRSTA
jgi:hypothetical protein